MIEESNISQNHHINTGCSPEIAMLTAMAPVTNTLTDDVIAKLLNLHTRMRAEPMDSWIFFKFLDEDIIVGARLHSTRSVLKCV